MPGDGRGRGAAQVWGASRVVAGIDDSGLWCALVAEMWLWWAFMAQSWEQFHVGVLILRRLRRTIWVTIMEQGQLY